MADTKKLKGAAEILFVQQEKTQKEISTALHISENTISNWANAGKWREKRAAFMNTNKKRVEDLKQVIGDITERRIEINTEIKQARADGDKESIALLHRELVNIGQEVAMYTKALERMDKDSRISLAVYLEVMDDIFKNLSAFDHELYLKTIPFQEDHLNTATTKLG